jgi:hypothetical protein
MIIKRMSVVRSLSCGALLLSSACLFEPDREPVLLTASVATSPAFVPAGTAIPVVLDSISLLDGCYHFDRVTARETRPGVVSLQAEGWHTLNTGCRQAIPPVRTR